MSVLWECIWKTSAATAVVWMLTLLLRRRSAALRHSLWLCGLAAFLVLPALLLLVNRTPPVQIAVRVPVALETLQMQLPIASPVSPAGTTRTSSVQLQLPTRIWLWIWLGGSMLIAIRRTRAVFRMQRIAGRSCPVASLSADHETEVRISGEVRTPLTWGFFRPLILLPAGALDWRPECLRSVLQHEREHIRRLDTLSHWLAELVFAAWWFHPFVWLARSRAAHERECACDDAVLRSGVRPSDYASELVNLASKLTSKGEPVMALSALSDFERRIKNLLLPGVDRRPANRSARLAAALATFVVIVPLVLLRAQAPLGQADLAGTVVDISGARVPDAMVIASAKGNREVTRANEAGEWSFSGIPAGEYTVEVMARGFAVAKSSIALVAGQRGTLDQTLPMGKIQETINVVGKGQPRRATAALENAAPKRIRVGGNVQASKLIKQPKVVYPEAAKSLGIEGTVLLNAVIGTDGNLLSVAVMNTLANPELAAAALEAVKQWQYQPTLLNGVPVEISTTITINYKLEM